jgi:hypothetical protein
MDGDNKAVLDLRIRRWITVSTAKNDYLFAK